MLPAEKINEVKRLLSLGLSQREVERRSGVSRAVVQRVASGKRKDRVVKPPEPWEVDWTGEVGKCPECNAKVMLPCMACIIRNIPAGASHATRGDGGSFEPGLDLDEEHRARYEQVKAWREMQADPNFTETPPDWPFRKYFDRKITAGWHSRSKK